MGLEIAEFMIALEDELDIRLDDASPFEAETEVTVGMIVDYVERKIREKEAVEVMAADYPQKVFEQTAAILAQFANVPENNITPETFLTELFPDKKRWRKMWQKSNDDYNEKSVILSQLVDIELQYKKCRYILALWGLSVLFLVPYVLYLLRLPMVGGLFIYTLLSINVIWRYCRNLIYIAERFPPPGITVGQFAEAITTYRRRFLASDGLPLTRSAIELRVIEILVESLIMKPNDIALTDRLVQDLKMG